MELMKDMFDMSAAVSQAVADMGYETPTPIQLEAIPPMKAGRDVIGQAQTGTGKTAAFGIPLADLIDPSDRAVQAICLCPTRELAMQTAMELTRLTRYRPGVRVAAVYGGAPIERQLRALRDGAQVIVGTPGRVMDHMNRGTLDLSAVRLAVLDEADEMLDMGFRDDIEFILGATPQTRQTCLFSATMPLPILALGKKYLTDPVRVTIEEKTLTVEKIEQSYISVRSFHKGELLSRLLALDDVKRALVFCNTKQGVEEVVTDLQHRGFAAAGLHGDMRQIERDAVMARYRNGLVGVLVATDVAARGLDIDDIEVVYNYDIPLDVEYYVHRIGRTGRAGKDGKAVTFVVGREVSRMWDYRRITGATILCRKAPDGHQVKQALMRRLAERVRQTALGGVSDEAKTLTEGLLEDTAPEQAIAAMFDIMIGLGGAQSDASIDLTPPEPVRPARPQARGQAVRRIGPYGRPVPPDMLPGRRGEAAPRRDRRPDDRGGHFGQRHPLPAGKGPRRPDRRDSIDRRDGTDRREAGHAPRFEGQKARRQSAYHPTKRRV